MMSRLISGLVGFAAIGLTAVGCGGAEDTASGVSSVSQALVGVDEFLYLRCNATGWNADSATRLSDPDGDGLFSLDFDVTQSWMVTGGDQCVLTRTNSASGFGSANQSFGSATSSIVVPPAQWSIGAANSTPATVRYPALGRYRATVNWETKTVTITPVETAQLNAYYYLRCNATGWDATASNRLATDGDHLELGYNVTQSWMVSGGDQCIVTRTNQLNGWGTSQVAMGTKTATTLVVPSGATAQTTVVSAGQYFSVRYPAVGAYEARLNPVTGELRIGTFGPDVPDTGLHGKVEALGGDRVRVTYDFADPEQLLDFAPIDAGTVGVSIVKGRLVVQDLGSPLLTGAYLTKGFKVDKMLYNAETLNGNYIMVHVGTIPEGTSHAMRGYNLIQRPDGQVLLGNRYQFGPYASVGLQTGVVYAGQIDTTQAGITWTLDGHVASMSYPYYGGTSRTITLGGYAATVAFDNVVLEGTVEGFESDGVETNPGTIHGAVANLPDGRVRISYDFSDEQQKYDFVAANDSTRREWNNGRLIVSTAGVTDALKVAFTRYNVRADHVSYRAEMLAGSHVNVYANTVWDNRWAPMVGCGAVHRWDGRVITADGDAFATSDTTPVQWLTPYVGDITLDASGIAWSVNGSAVTVASTCNAGTDGAFGFGGYDSDVSIDDIVIEGQLE